MGLCIYVSLISGLESKKRRLQCIRIVLQCLGILPKNQGEILVSGFGSATINTCMLVLLDLCVVWRFREIFVFCLSSHLLSFLPGCEQLHYSTTTVLQIFQSASMA